MDIITVIATTVVLIITVVVVYFKYIAFKYWEKRSVPFISPSIPAGNVGSILTGKKNFGVHFKNLYDEFTAKNCKQAGIYFWSIPVYFPIDLDIIKNILIKDFQNFGDRGVYFNEEHDPLSAHIFSIEGLKWKNLRNKLSPTFTSGKLKMMFDIFVQCSDRLHEFCESVVDKREPFNTREVLAKFTTDIIGSCAFGLEFNSLKNPDSEFRLMGKKVTEPQSIIDALRGFIAFSCPALAHLINMRVFDKEATKFFYETVKNTVDYREKNNFRRNDFLQLLIDLKNGGNTDENKISLMEVAAQAFLFFIGGFETSSTTMTFCLYELARDQEIQDKVRDEINSLLKDDDKMTYDILNNMTYMNKVINETLRKYPPLPIMSRVCTQTYKVPETDLIIPKGRKIMIPVLGIQRDPKYYPNPDKFDPERFNEENKSSRHPCTFLSFGEGPRICMGIRFGIMQTKAGLTTLLRNYNLKLHFDCNIKSEIEFLVESIVLRSKENITLELKKL